MRYIDYDIAIDQHTIELDAELTGKLLPKLGWQDGDLWTVKIVGDVITLYRLEE
jgi:hypothetical protein